MILQIHFLMWGRNMNEKSWNDFEKTGKISDYLNYKLSNKNVINEKINSGEIKPALPTDVGKPEESSDFKKLQFSVNGGIGYANQDQGHSPQGTGL